MSIGRVLKYYFIKYFIRKFLKCSFEAHHNEYIDHNLHNKNK